MVLSIIRVNYQIYFNFIHLNLKIEQQIQLDKNLQKIIKQFKKQHEQQQKQETKVINKPVDDSTLTIDIIIQGNQAFYNPVLLPSSQLKENIEEESQEDKPNFFQEIQLLTKIPEIESFNLIYNNKTIFKNEGISYEEAKNLDKIRIKRKEREQKASGTSIVKETIAAKKQYVRLYKNQISKLCFIAPKNLFLISQHLGNKTQWEKQLRLQDFNGQRPSLSIVQEKTTGRFYIYNRKQQRVRFLRYQEIKKRDQYIKQIFRLPV